jgi:hypothetical protein
VSVVTRLMARGAGGPVQASSRRRRLGRSGWLVAGLAGAWLVPLVAHLVSLDVAVLVVLVVAVGLLLRGGSSVMDRLMLAIGLVAGGLLVAGLVFSVWPWGLAPVPVGGVCLSVVVAAGWLARRRPMLPRRWVEGRDVVVAGAGGVALWGAYAPLAKLSPVQQLVFSTGTSDRFRQFALFDAVHRLGGYAFLHQGRAAALVPSPMQAMYPSGSHFLLVVADTFWRSTADPGMSAAEFSRYFLYLLAGYAFLIMAIVWAAGWVAGPRLAGWARAAVCAGVAALVLGAPLADTFINGLDSDIFGLAFLALAVAVTARPPARAKEQVLLAGALLIAVAYAYNLFAIPLALGMAAAAVSYRRRLLRHWRFTLPAAIITAALALFPTAVALASGWNPGSQALALTGWLVPLRMRLIIAMALVFTATAISRKARHLPGWQAMAAQLLATLTVTAGFAAYQLTAAGHISYYFNKLVMTAYLTAVIALGAAAAALPPLRRHARRAGPVLQVSAAAIGAAAAIFLATFFQSHLAGQSPLIWTQSRLAVWSQGKIRAPAGRLLPTLTRARLVGGGVPTLVLTGRVVITEYADDYAAAINQDYGVMNGTLNAVRITLRDELRKHLPVSTAEFLAGREAFREGPAGLRFVVADPVLAAKLRALAAAHPSAHATVVVFPALRRYGKPAALAN